ncbi:hypothetical protein GCM10020358_66450 [Amorphoplanes nipponensis]|uniref:Uncharacterized protein n=1 Tax=Actinoplanes nipponensis TaxID=135950 RepID=A0A919JLB5_9ACTN|nr:hypothetical protein [Actinoplanes nipponensis]GIE51758.1 hypothetical protein Ani05nite_52920 [Actinoplanes nipponensis]
MSLDSDVDPNRRRLGSIMAAAAATRTTGPGEHTVLLPKISTDPLDDLVERVRPQLGRAVDSLHVAAALEADGLTDRGARVEYGYHDVFALATEVFRRLGPILPPARGASARDPRAWRDSLRVIAHGPLYVLPSTAFPAVLAIVGRRSLVLGLVLASTLGWVYAGAAAHAAYRMLGLGRPRSAARILTAAAVTAPLAGAVAGAVLVRLTGGGPALLAMITCQVAYQLTSTVLVIYRREQWLALAMTPAFLAGAAYLVLGRGLRPWSVAVAAGCVLAGFLVAVLLAVHRGRAASGPEPALRVALRPEVPALLGVSAYGLCSAVLLLHAEAPYLLGRLDIAIAAAPLILTMGVVEWRAERFRPRAVALVRRVERPREFVRGVWLLLGQEVAICLLAPAVPAAALLAALAYLGLLSGAGIVMTAAHVALGGAYLLAFLLAGRERFGWLCASMLAAITVHVGLGALLGAAPLLGRPGSALVDTSLYLGSVLLLQALFGLGLVPILGQARHYR